MTRLKNSNSRRSHWLKCLTDLDYSAARTATLLVSMALDPCLTDLDYSAARTATLLVSMALDPIQ